MLEFDPKAPGDIDSFTFDWSSDLVGGSSIASVSTISSDTPDLIISDVLAIGSTVCFQAAGGTAGECAVLTCIINTSDGRTLSRIALLPVTDL